MARIGVDLDGVCYDFTGVFLKYMVEEMSYWVGGAAVNKWDFYLDWGMSRELFLNYCRRSIKEGYLFTKGDPLPGTKAALDALRDAGHTIVFITDRGSLGEPELAMKATENWLENHGLSTEDDQLWLSADKAVAPTDYFIDDRLENYDALEAAGVKVYLWDRPWNQVDEGWGDEPRRRRVSSWDEFLEAVAGSEYLTNGAGSAELGVDFEPGVFGSKVPETRVVSSTGGEKGSKLARFDLIPMGALWKVAELYGKGAEKYDDWNWRKGYPFHLSQAAMMRHYALWVEGQTYDEETGCHHLAAVVFHALSLMTFEEEHPEMDDRFRKDDAA